MTHSEALPNQFWLDRWTLGQTGFHQGVVEPLLVATFEHAAPTRVLVPLCGKSLDMCWLASRGHTVLGVELSALACEAFFKENAIPFTKSVEGAFTVYRGDRVTLLNGDIFALCAQDLGKLGGLYDRAAIVALDRSTRARYAALLTKLVRECSSANGPLFVTITFERIPDGPEGPPFSVMQDEFKQLYEANFSIDSLSRTTKPLRPGTEAPLVVECAYRLALRPRS